MDSLQQPADRVAIGLSLLCALHCLATPLLVVLLPATVATHLQSEALHAWLVLGVLPTSILALTLGCKKHQRKDVLAIGMTGLITLIAAIVLSEMGFGELIEKILTVTGTAIIAWAHVRNYQLCRSNKCECR